MKYKLETPVSSENIVVCADFIRKFKIAGDGDEDGFVGLDEDWNFVVAGSGSSRRRTVTLGPLIAKQRLPPPDRVGAGPAGALWRQ